PAAAVETSARPRAGADIAPLAIARVPAGYTGVDLGALREGYFSSVRSRVAGNRHYPVPARRRGHEGRPVVSFLLNKAGELRELSLLESSGHATLDRAALAAVEKAAPFPAIPEMLGERSMRFKLPVSFRLESP
ncbi:MAG: energy transducer TonB, partial [Nitrospinaceae bacterium]